MRANRLLQVTVAMSYAIAVAACESVVTETDVALQIQEDVFTKTCAECHHSTFIFPDLSSKASVQTQMVWRYATENPHAYRIKPGDPEASWLITRLRGLDGTDRMPPGGKLSDALITTIEE